MMKVQKDGNEKSTIQCDTNNAINLWESYIEAIVANEGSSQANQDTIMNSALGDVSVVISWQHIQN